MIIDVCLSYRVQPSSFLLYSSPPQFRNLAAACSGVMSRCGSPIISYLQSQHIYHKRFQQTVKGTHPTKNFRTVALRSNGG